jgi:hypothetical protein
MKLLLEPTDEILEQICEAAWNGGKGEGVYFTEIENIDCCNQMLYGIVDILGEEYGFIIESGNWNGTVVRKWGLAEDVGLYERTYEEAPTFIPIDPDDYLLYVTRMRKESWFKSAERDYHAARASCSWDSIPGSGRVNEEYYRQWATNLHLHLGLLSGVHWQIVKENAENIQFISDASEEIQEWVLLKRPDLVLVIPNLSKSLKEKYSHEVELGKVDL